MESQTYPLTNGNGNHAELPTVSPESVAEYLKSLLDGRPLATMPNVLLCRDAKIRLDDNGVGLVREYLKANRETPDYAEWHGAIEAALNPPRKYVYTEAELLALSDIEPLLKSKFGKVILPSEGQVLLSAPTRSYKTFIALHWAKQLASQGYKVGFYLGERFRAFRKRVNAYNALYVDAAKSSQNISYVDVSAVLQDGFSIKENVQEFIAAHTPLDSLDVAFVDTFRAVGEVVNENDNAEVGTALRKLRHLAPLTVIVHHTRKDNRIYAGAGAFDSNTDSFVEVLEDDKAKLPAMHKKLLIHHNDFESDIALAYKLLEVRDSFAAVEVDLAELADTAKLEAQAEADAEWIAAIEACANAEGLALRSDIAKQIGLTEEAVRRNEKLKKAIQRGVIVAGKIGKKAAYKIGENSL